MRKLLFVLCLWLAIASMPAFADTFYLTDGGGLSGELVKSDDLGIMIHLSDESYTNIAWAKISQDTIKHLAADPKARVFAEPFIEPDAAQRSQKADIKVNSVKRLDRPESPSVFAGFFKSSVGLFILFVVYLANLFAAYEISIVKTRSAVQVMGAAAVLPVIAPVIFLSMPMKIEVPAEDKEAEQLASEVAAAQEQEKIQIAEASWKTDASGAPGTPASKKPEPQIYPRGKFTFNKRFLETRFADFVNGGELAKRYSMELRTMKAQLAVERIAQIGQNDIILDTPHGQVSVAFADIQEIKLNPKTA